METVDLEKLFDAKLSAVAVEFKSVHEKLDAIVVQTTKTNGRVTKLEGWVNKIIGGLLLTEVVILPIAFIVLKDKI